GYMSALMAYHATPAFMIRGWFSIGQPASPSQSLNHKLLESNLATTNDYLASLYRLGFQGVLLIQSDADLERLTGIAMDSGSIEFYNVEDSGLRYQWSVNGVSASAFGEPSFRKWIRAQLGISKPESD
ncbi:MAG: hypothetical protein AAB303_01990, partial [Chloroflexota bacterium]